MMKFQQKSFDVNNRLNGTGIKIDIDMLTKEKSIDTLVNAN